MLPWLIALGIGTVLIVANWDKITGWLRDFIPKLEAAWKELREYMPHGAKIFGDLIMEGGKRLSRIMHKLYYKDNGRRKRQLEKWMQTTFRRILGRRLSEWKQGRSKRILPRKSRKNCSWRCDLCGNGLQDCLGLSDL